MFKKQKFLNAGKLNDIKIKVNVDNIQEIEKVDIFTCLNSTISSDGRDMRKR